MVGRTRQDDNRGVLNRRTHSGGSDWLSWGVRTDGTRQPYRCVGVRKGRTHLSGVIVRRNVPETKGWPLLMLTSVSCLCSSWTDKCVRTPTLHGPYCPRHWRTTCCDEPWVVNWSTWTHRRSNGMGSRTTSGTHGTTRRTNLTRCDGSPGATGCSLTGSQTSYHVQRWTTDPTIKRTVHDTRRGVDRPSRKYCR